MPQARTQQHQAVVNSLTQPFQYTYTGGTAPASAKLSTSSAASQFTQLHASGVCLQGSWRMADKTILVALYVP